MLPRVSVISKMQYKRDLNHYSVQSSVYYTINKEVIIYQILSHTFNVGIKLLM